MKPRPNILIVGTLATLALVAAGCGGGHPSGVAHIGAATTTTRSSAPANPQTAIIAFSNCMRSNGVANFPDPQHVAPHAFKLAISTVVANNPRFRSAQSACRHLLPPSSQPSQQELQQQRAQLADMLSFAQCMRRHGLARFPDPNAQGELSVETVIAAGIDVHAPRVLRVVDACLPASHGLLTRAKVREAIDGGHQP